MSSSREADWQRWVLVVVTFLGLTVVFAGMLLALRWCGGPEGERRWPRPVGSASAHPDPHTAVQTPADPPSGTAQ